MGRTLDLGQNPLPTGTYLFALSMQVGWNDSGGPLAWDGFAQFVDGSNPIYTMPWGLFTSNTAATGSGTSACQVFFFQATITNLNELWIKTQGNFYLLGASLVVFPLPANVVTSPGFV